MSEFDPIAVEVEAHRVTMEELISKGMELRENADQNRWQLGDLAITVTREFGSKELAVFAKGIGVEVSTIRRYRDISKAYPIEIREEYKILPWSAFRQIAAREDRFEILKRAADEGWSVEKLGEMTRTRHEGEQPVIDDGEPVPPKPELLFCTGCRRWYIPKEFACPSEGQCPDLHK